MTNEEMRAISGTIKSNDKLVLFLYLLLRDKLPVGDVEEIMELVEKPIKPTVGQYTFTNGWLARYAECIAGRLKEE